MKFLSKLGMGLAGVLVFFLFFYAGVSLTQTTPKVAKFITGINNWEYTVQEQTVVYYSDGKKMGNLGYKREYSKDFPEFMKDAVVAVEDRRFYEHSGLDSKGIGRAIYKDVISRSKSEGGSTITMQLARTLFLSNEKVFSRKVKEVFIASAIEGKYTKEAILNMYLNEIYMGRGCTGMGIAAQAYFGKDVMELNEAEICALVGIIQAPEYYSPDRNLEALKKRQAVVISVLVKQGLISAEEGEVLKEQPLSFKPFRQTLNAHPYYMAYLANQLEGMVGAQQLYHGGLHVYTSVDSRMQKAAEYAVEKQAATFAARGISAKDIAVVSIDPKTGGIKAMVGGVDWEKNQLNMAILPRQPGSAIKPLYYAAAIDEGIINQNTELNNSPRSFNGYTPKNYAASPGMTTTRQAIVNSYNVASVEVLNKLGVEKAVSYLKDYGITTIEPTDHNLALGLGGMTRGISPVQMAAAYAIFPTNGVYTKYYNIEKIVNSKDVVIYKNRSKSKTVIKSSTAATMDSILKDTVSYGTGSTARIAIRSGGKTGTTSDSKDLWYLGYTSELVTAVWTGNSDGTPVNGSRAYGGSVSGLIWKEYMNRLISQGVFAGKYVEVPEETPEEEEPDIEEPIREEPGTEQPPDVEVPIVPAPEPVPPGDNNGDINPPDPGEGEDNQT
ncbi:Penicillin-binding protein 1A [Syntrophomonas zehnderi OL-4]|uniref:Penicillin-binding protein 1A n=1 Tax=Syntrophomonas zehnderi OL-4 TaxID=690567 RepID=A0A0E4C9T7_9FIRM|nr:PBP1A family penicillin-binding protein [Syntrophomonas zehnderi]CFY11218.1 Penicillin-binding protein 1A [Syntrophomonas zehnderi OL-4]